MANKTDRNSTQAIAYHAILTICTICLVFCSIQAKSPGSIFPWIVLFVADFFLKRMAKYALCIWSVISTISGIMRLMNGRVTTIDNEIIVDMVIVCASIAIFTTTILYVRSVSEKPHNSK